MKAYSLVKSESARGDYVWTLRRLAHDVSQLLSAAAETALSLEDEFADRLTSGARAGLLLIGQCLARATTYLDTEEYFAIRGRTGAVAVDVTAVLSEVVDCSPELGRPSAILTIASPLGWVVATPAALTRCLSNLLHNAVKCGPATGVARIRVYSEVRGAMLRVTVADNGRGLSRTRCATLFRSVDGAHDAPAGPHGLGLPSVQEQIARLGGRCGVHSKRGQGSRFWLELPCAPPPRSTPCAGPVHRRRFSSQSAPAAAGQNRLP